MATEAARLNGKSFVERKKIMEKSKTSLTRIGLLMEAADKEVDGRCVACLGTDTHSSANPVNQDLPKFGWAPVASEDICFNMSKSSGMNRGLPSKYP